MRPDCGVVWLYSPVDWRFSESRSSIWFTKEQRTGANYGKRRANSYGKKACKDSMNDTNSR